MKADMMKPKKLQPGDKVATVSSSWGGPGAFPYRYEAGKPVSYTHLTLPTTPYV